MYYYFPIALIVVSNVAYHIFAKAVPGQLNFLVSLLITYFVAGALTLAMFFVLPQISSIGQSEVSLWEQIKGANWAPYAFGIAIVGLEMGNILMYRAGWNISLGSLVSNISLAVILVIIGGLLYKEVLTLNHGIGIILCLIGLVFINR
ncbi:MAG: EamA family transporter [Anaerovoracaceae bacterium]|jgi:drug/metabolite transporter (DMT)-like permease|nr:EamA family transporter [Anaerovoracaceae bacterium]